METEDRVEYKISTIIYQTFATLFLILGTTANILSAIVYSRKKMRKTSYSVYLFALALVDLCVTVNGNTRIFFMSFDIGFLKTEQTQLQKSYDSPSNQQIFKGIDIRETSLAACRIHRFLTYYFLQLSSIILCLLSIDRFFGCVLVLKSSRFCKPSIARKIILITMFLLLIFNCHFLGFMGYETSSNITDTNRTIIVCHPDRASNYYSVVWDLYFYADSIVYCILPFIIMIICNISIIAKIISSRIRSKQVIITKKKNKNFISKNSRSMLATEKRISFILIMISVSFLVLTIPVFIMENLITDTAFNNPFLEIALAISYMLMYSNHVINFFFYCSLGPSFRKEVKKLFPIFFCIKNKIDPVKVSKYNTAQFGASTSANPRKLISRNEMSTFSKTTIKQNRVLAASYCIKIEEEIQSTKPCDELQVMLHDGSLPNDLKQTENV